MDRFSYAALELLIRNPDQGMRQLIRQTRLRGVVRLVYTLRTVAAIGWLCAAQAYDVESNSCAFSAKTSASRRGAAVTLPS